MSKKTFAFPMVFLTGTDTGSASGGATGYGNMDDDLQFGWYNWLGMFYDQDFNGDSEPGTWADYVAWWQSHSTWTEEEFKAANGGNGYSNPIDPPPIGPSEP